jgi:hypothetical protein
MTAEQFGINVNDCVENLLKPWLIVMFKMEKKMLGALL